MNNVPVFAVFVLFFFSQLVFGQEPSGPQERETSTYAFSLQPFFGVIHGQSEEIVYPDNTKAPLLSQLLWDMKPVFYYGLQMDFSRAEPMDKWGFFSSLSLKFGIPGQSGNMEDRDWQSVENTDLTNYSIHDNFIREMFLLDFSAGFTVPFLRVLLLKAFVNVSYMNFRFSGFGGHYKYARIKTRNPHSNIPETFYPIDDNPDTGSFSEKVINYSQDWLIAAPGVSFGYLFLKRFFAELSFQISPLIFCSDLDEHLRTKVQYRDYMRGGLLIEPGAELSFACNNWITLSFEFSWRYISRTKGETFQRTYGTGDYSRSGTAGAGLSVADYGLFLKVRV
jgi:outer membrane protease